MARISALLGALVALLVGLLAPAAQAATKPGAPPTAGVPGNAAITARWTAPASGGKAITAYQVSVQRYNALKKTWGTASLYLTSATARSKTVTATNGATYRLKARAKNSLGWGAWSATFTLVAGTPTAPRSVAAVPTTGKVTVTWSAPATANGAAVSGYGVAVRLYNGATKTWGSWTSYSLAASARSKAVAGAGGSVWQAKVRARNKRGWGIWSPTRTATIPVPAGFTMTQEAMPTTLSIGVGTGCVIRAGGTVRCWGGNGYGELGIGSTSQFVQAPGADVVGLTGVKQVSSGTYNVCAVDGNGTVWCWGRNAAGILANSSIPVGFDVASSSSVPVQVQGLPGPASAVALGQEGSHACAVLVSGELWCWGVGPLGQLGNGVLDDQSVKAPAKVVGLLGPVLQVAVGYLHTCAIVVDSSDGDKNAVQCWGYNNAGEVGLDVAINPYAVAAPTRVSGLGAATAIAAGKDHSCAVNAGAVMCWGASGFLGSAKAVEDTNTTGDSRMSTPYTADGLGSGMLGVEMGEGGTCATSLAGAVWCWGNGGYNGDPAYKTHDLPWQLADLGSPGYSVSFGYSWACTRLANADVWCWGEGRGVNETGYTQPAPVKRTGV